MCSCERDPKKTDKERVVLIGLFLVLHQIHSFRLVAICRNRMLTYQSSARARILSLTLTIIKRRWARERKWKLVYVLEYVTLSLLLLAFKLSSFSDATCVLAGRWFFSSFLSSENKSNRTEGKKARVQTRTHTHKLKLTIQARQDAGQSELQIGVKSNRNHTTAQYA